MRFTVVLLALLVTSCHFSRPPLDPGDVATLATGRAIVMSVCSNGGGTGSGIVVGPRHLVTAYHVVEDCPNEDQVVVIGNQGFLMRLLRAAPQGDVAVLELHPASPTEFDSWVKVGEGFKKGDWVCVKHVYPVEQTACEKVRYIDDIMMKDGPVVKGMGVAGLPSRRGNSGGGVLNTGGRLVAVVVGTMYNGRGTAIAPVPSWLVP